MEYKALTNESPEKAIVEEIYLEAFPPLERDMLLDDILSYSANHECLKLIVAVDEGKVAGFFCTVEFEACTFLMFMAVNSALRGGGYGTKMLNHLVGSVGEKPLVATIETPLDSAANYEQRVKRQRFYERNGMFLTGHEVDEKGMSMSVISTRLDFDFERYAGGMIETLSEMEKAINGA